MALATLYITAPDREIAETLGRTLLEKRLAACANIVDSIHSMYWWEGKIESGSEVLIFAKTQMRLVRECVAAIKEVHPDDVPCVTASPILKANPDYARWVETETLMDEEE